MSIYKQKKPKISHILAIDFGKSKVGLAFSEKETKTAFALGVLMVGDNFFNELEEIIKEKEINLVLLGKPKWMEDNQDQKYEKLIDFIQNKLKINLEMVEEMFTSKMAQSNLKEAGKKDISKDDAEAARIMLQDWLDAI